jgi:hypothetical protein
MTVVTRERATGKLPAGARTSRAPSTCCSRAATKVLTDAGVVPSTTRGGRPSGARRGCPRGRCGCSRWPSARGATSSVDRAEAERGLTFLGMVGMIDPPRAEVKAAIEAARARASAW